MKRILSVVMCFVLLLGCVTFASAQSAVIEVATKEQFDAIRNDLTANYKLTADIEFTASDFAEGGAYYNDGAGFLPFGDSENAFAGTLDGNGHTVSGLVLNGDCSVNIKYDYFGLVACNSGTVCNLRLQDVNVNYTAKLPQDVMLLYVGVGGVTGVNFGTVQNCAVVGEIAVTNKGAILNAGSVVGWNRGGVIQNCYVDTDMVLNYDAQSLATLGGVCGGMENYVSQTALLSSCYVNTRQTVNNISDGTNAYIGPITARVLSTNIENCYYLDNGVTPVIREDVEGALATCYVVSTQAAKVQDTFTALDFTSTWKMNNLSPVLAAFDCLHQTGDYISTESEHYKICGLCSQKVSAGVHTSVTQAYEGQEPDCIHDGLGYRYCKDCLMTLQDNIPLAANGAHTYDNSCDIECNVCRETRTIQHTYDNACDTECNVCGETRTVGEHQYDNACDATCNICNAPRTVGAHQYDNNCDTTCNICGETRTIRHTYDNACDTECNVCRMTRTITHSYGEYVYNNDATYEKDGTKTRTCSVCGNKETITAEGTKLTKPVITNPFNDVESGKFYYDAVLWAVGENVTSGTSATTFSPNSDCTRGQIVTFLWRAAGAPKATTTETPFTDIKEGSYYYDAVIWAVENGITSGTTATTFSPNSTCTRGQIVTFLWRAKGEQKATIANPFKDTTGGAYYTEAMLWAVENGITTGTSATTFSPNNACTRGQCVTFLYRSFGN